jgi:hypothetical protein
MISLYTIVVYHCASGSLNTAVFQRKAITCTGHIKGLGMRSIDCKISENHSKNIPVNWQEAMSGHTL